MKLALIVTGTPGTGKTTFAKKLAQKLHASYVDVGALIKEQHLFEKYNRSLQTYDVDVDKLVQFLMQCIKAADTLLVLDSHLSHYLPPKYVKRCYVTMCALPVLKRRLQKRKYSEKKIRENLDAEILQICLLEAVAQKHKVKVIDTTKGLKNVKIPSSI